MDTLLTNGRDLTPINMKSVIGVVSFPLLRVDKKQSGNFGSVNGGHPTAKSEIMSIFPSNFL